MEGFFGVDILVVLIGGDLIRHQGIALAEIENKLTQAGIGVSIDEVALKLIA